MWKKRTILSYNGCLDASLWETLAIPFIVDSTVINCCVFVINNVCKKIELQNMYNIENIVTK